MAKEKAFPTQPPKAAAWHKGITLGEVSPDAYYQVEMLVPYTLGRIRFLPINRYKVKGYILSQIPEFRIKSAEII